MLRFDRRSGNLAITDLGRAASHFYISNESVFRFNGAMMPTLPDAAAVNLVCLASEFDQVKASNIINPSDTYTTCNPQRIPKENNRLFCFIAQTYPWKSPW